MREGTRKVHQRIFRSYIRNIKRHDVIWTLLFFASIAQGIFLIPIIWVRRASNPQASLLLILLLFVMVIINVDYLITTSDIYQSFSSLYGISFGTMFLIGPLFYLYARSVMEEQYKWHRSDFLHFIPFILKYIHSFMFMMLPTTIKIKVIDEFLAGRLELMPFGTAMIMTQIVHMGLYLYLTRKMMEKHAATYQETPFIISFRLRVKWTRSMFSAFVLFLGLVLTWFIVALYKGYFLSVADYTNVFLTSAIIYFIAYHVVLNPELINPDFSVRRGIAAISFKDTERAQSMLRFLMEDKRIFLNPDIDLNSVSRELGIPVYQCSRLINSTFGKGFFDFINTYRIEEVKRRLDDPAFSHFSILGIALQTGFNSKSSFNAAFRKVTGTTPREYRKRSDLA